MRLDSLLKNRLFNLGEAMAEKNAGSSTKTTVRRIKASDDGSKKPTAKAVKAQARPKTTQKVAKKPVKKRPVASTDGIGQAPDKNPIKALGGYFKGAWHELKQVRWPTRSATWSMTLAVLIFTGFFVGLVILLDAGFTWIFEQILR